MHIHTYMHTYFLPQPPGWPPARDGGAHRAAGRRLAGPSGRRWDDNSDDNDNDNTNNNNNNMIIILIPMNIMWEWCSDALRTYFGYFQTSYLGRQAELLRAINQQPVAHNNNNRATPLVYVSFVYRLSVLVLVTYNYAVRPPAGGWEWCDG